MRGTALILALLVAACGSGPDPAALERQFAMMEHAGASPDELCSSAKAIAEAWLKREDRTEFEQADLAARIQCTRALLDRL